MLQLTSLFNVQYKMKLLYWYSGSGKPFLFLLLSHLLQTLHSRPLAQNRVQAREILLTSLSGMLFFILLSHILCYKKAFALHFVYCFQIFLS